MNGAQLAALTAALERRWIVLDTLGRHVTVGRHSDPSDAELDAARIALEGQGAGGWLAVLEGRYYGRRRVRVRKVLELVPGAVSFDLAAALFHATRERCR